MRQLAYAEHLIFAPQRCFYSDTPHNASKPKCTLRTGGGRHRAGEILEDNNVLIDV